MRHYEKDITIPALRFISKFENGVVKKRISNHLDSSINWTSEDMEPSLSRKGEPVYHQIKRNLLSSNNSLEHHGFVTVEGNVIKITDKGREVANSNIVELELTTKKVIKKSNDQVIEDKINKLKNMTEFDRETKTTYRVERDDLFALKVALLRKNGQTRICPSLRVECAQCIQSGEWHPLSVLELAHLKPRRSMTQEERINPDLVAFMTPTEHKYFDTFKLNIGESYLNQI